MSSATVLSSAQPSRPGGQVMLSPTAGCVEGVYVVAATVPAASAPGAVVTATGEFTVNVKIPYPQSGGSGS